MPSFLEMINNPHKFFGSMRNGDVVVLAFSTFFGEIDFKGFVPIADEFCCIKQSITQVARASFLHM